MKTRKIWLGLGAAAVSSTLTTATVEAVTLVPAPGIAATDGLELPAILTADTHKHGAAANAGDGGEGGEAGTAADAKLDPMVRFYRDVQLVRGHALVGDELVRAGLWEDALPHFLHPVEELYAGIDLELTRLKMNSFLRQLKVLVQTVKAKNLGTYDAALKALNTELDQIDAQLKTGNGDWPAFTVATAMAMLQTAASEYDASIEAGKFALAVEYQDSRGFVWQAERLIGSVSADLEKSDAEGLEMAKGEFKILKTAWPAAVPPEAPVMDVAKVTATISKIELALGIIR